jgi:flavin-dependent dehydrogenase
MPGRPNSRSVAASPASAATTTRSVGGEPYDVIIAGASFAGLAAARQLRGRVLLIDREPIGEGVTSACAAPVRIVEMMGAEASVQQVHEALVIHAPGRNATWPLPEPFCTFDYRRFCAEAAQAAPGVELRVASVLGRDGDRVRTSAGSVRGRFLIDATGPRAALAGHGRPRHVAFGIESEVGTRVEPGLHFYFLPEVRDGYAWAFPCGEGTRFGVLSYRGRTKLLPVLEQFMARFGARPAGRHGGYLATGWTPGVIDDVFVAGDAAGYCLPLSGEGIRTAVLAGMRCGELIQQVLDGRLLLAQAQAAYRASVAADRRRYRGLLWGNLLLLGLPQRWVGPAAAVLARRAIRRWFFGSYLRIGTAAAGESRKGVASM